MKGLCSLFSLAALCFLAACSPVLTQNMELGASESSLTKDSIWTHAYVTFLEEDSASILGDVADVRYCNGIYAVLNGDRTAISLFDKDGSQQASLNRKGHGHEEYIGISDFDLTQDKLYILCYPNTRIIIADLDCNIQRVLNIPYAFTNLVCYEGNLYAYLPSTRSLYAYDGAKWKEIFKEEPLPALSYASNPVFFKLDGELLYCSKGGSCIHRISKGKVDELFTFDYPDKGKIMKRLKQSRMLQGKERILIAPPVMYSLTRKEDSYVLVYTFRGVYRVSEVSAGDFSIIRDGDLLWSPLPTYSNGTDAISCQFLTKDEQPFGTHSGKTVFTNKKKWGNGRMALIRYTK